MLRITKISCLILAYCLFPSISHEEVLVLPFRCDSSIVKERGAADEPEARFYIAECRTPNLATGKYEFIVPDERQVQREAIRQQAISEAHNKLRSVGILVYEKMEVDRDFLKKADFTTLEKKWNDTLDANPKLIGTTVERTIKENLRDTIKNLLTTDEEFRQEIAQILKSK